MRFVSVSTVCLLIFSVFLLAIETRSSDEHITSDSARTKAIDLIGLNENIGAGQLDGSQTSIVQFHDTIVPVVGPLNDRREAWRMDFRNLTIPLSKTSPEEQSRRPVDATVYIDAETGRFLQAVFVRDTASLSRDPTIDETSRQLDFVGEAYTGVPELDPSVSILQAFDIQENHAYAHLAEKIVVNYVMYRFRDKPPVPAWIIYMRGLPPIGSADVPEYKRTNMRTVVDATQLLPGPLWTSNIPYPELSEEEAESDGVEK